MEMKPWYLSKSVWGSMAAIAAMLINLAFGQGTVTESEIVEVISAIVGALGGAYALYGRIVANTQITR